MINQINQLQTELAKRNQMLMEAHFQNKKLQDKIINIQEKYRILEKNYNDLEEMYDCTL